MMDRNPRKTLALTSFLYIPGFIKNYSIPLLNVKPLHWWLYFASIQILEGCYIGFIGY